MGACGRVRADSPTTPSRPKRGSAATDAVGMLPRFTALSVHDDWKPDCHDIACRSALCTLHHLRELAFVEEIVSPALGQGSHDAAVGDEDRLEWARTRYVDTSSSIADICRTLEISGTTLWALCGSSPCGTLIHPTLAC